MSKYYKKTLQKNTTFEAKYIVQQNDSAIIVGSGTLNVLSTPLLIAYVEKTASNFIQEHLNDEYTSVGLSVEIKHLAPTKIGKQINCLITISTINNEKEIVFEFKVFDQDKMIAIGNHIRVIVHSEIFMMRLEK